MNFFDRPRALRQRPVSLEIEAMARCGIAHQSPRSFPLRAHFTAQTNIDWPA